MSAEQDLFDDAELSEAPTIDRPDAEEISIRCDENGNVHPDQTILETRGLIQQTELWKRATLHKISVASKLRSLGRIDLAAPLEVCHTKETFALCTSCRRVTKYLNRCERHYCPECQPRLSNDRRKSVEWWAREIREPKHVVLTVRNTEHLTKKHVQIFKDCFARLRRTKFARNWRGGFYRLEVTNERAGWHLHLHALIDAGWISQKGLSDTWGKILGQDVAIVHVRDVHSRDYLAEVTKYTVKGSQLAGWSAEKIAEFIDAFDGLRSFGVFGCLFGKRTQWKEWLDSIREHGHTCACGGTHFRLLDANELEFENIQRERRLFSNRPMPPPAASPKTAELFGEIRSATEMFR